MGTDDYLPVILLWILSPLVIVAGIITPIALFYLVAHKFGLGSYSLDESKEKRQ